MANNNDSLLDETGKSGTMNTYYGRFKTVAGDADDVEGGTAEHVVALDKCVMDPKFCKADEEQVTMYSMDFVVLSSTCMEPGTRVSEGFFIGREGKKGRTPKKKLNGFGRAVLESLGVPQDVEKDPSGDEYNKAVSSQLKKLCEMDPATGNTIKSQRKFTGRGLVLKVVSKAELGSDKKVYVNNEYLPIAQTKEDIKAKRALIEAVPEKDSPAPKKTAHQSAEQKTSAPSAAQIAAEAAASAMLDD